MTNEKCRNLWKARTADYEASGLSVREWCAKTGFTVHQLRYWLRKLRTTADSQSSSDAGAGWACVELVGDGPAAAGAELPEAAGKRDAVVSLRVGVATIEVRRGFDSILLSEVLRVVVATC